MRAYVDRDEYLDELHEHRDDPSTRAPDVDECHGCLEVRPLMQGRASVVCGSCGEDSCSWCAECWENWENGVPKCSICGREIDFTEGAPLCVPCSSTAREAGKQAVSAMRYKKDTAA